MPKLQSFTQSSYLAKDQAKSDKATCFVGHGARYTSTYAYAESRGDLANKGEYTAEDVVFVSVNGGARFNASNWGETKAELLRAMNVPVKGIIADNAKDRLREYNKGERHLAAFLEAHGWVETTKGNGEWVKA